MLRYFPDLQSIPVEREGLETEETEHPFIVGNKKLIEEDKKRIERIRANSKLFRANHPDHWKQFEEDLLGMLGSAYSVDRRSPLHYCGAKVDANYFSLVKAYTLGRIEILEALFSIIEKSPVLPPSPPPKKDSKKFFKIIVDRFRKA